MNELSLFEEKPRVKYRLRPYQQDAVREGIAFLSDKKLSGGAIEVLPTGSGKSLVIAGIIEGLTGKTIVLQPSKEILEQNFAKLVAYGFYPKIYSASLGKKQVGKITLATIGSVISSTHLFSDFQHIIIDECDLVNPYGGMYKQFLTKLKDCKVLGLTATPYRLATNSFGSELRFITRMKGGEFKRVVYLIQNGKLFNDGFLCPLKYYDIAAIERDKLQKNSTGADYTEKSLKLFYKTSGFADKLLKTVTRLADIRRNVLVFTNFIEESAAVVRGLPGAVMVTGETKKAERERILNDFKLGRIKVVCNVGVLTVGFDFPGLETVVIARPTMSLRLYYQMIGRCVRTSPDKPEGSWVVDMGGNLALFGKVENLYIDENGGKYVVRSGGRQLTNVILTDVTERDYAKEAAINKNMQKV